MTRSCHSFRLLCRCYCSSIYFHPVSRTSLAYSTAINSRTFPNTAIPFVFGFIFSLRLRTLYNLISMSFSFGWPSSMLLAFFAVCGALQIMQSKKKNVACNFVGGDSGPSFRLSILGCQQKNNIRQCMDVTNASCINNINSPNSGKPNRSLTEICTKIYETIVLCDFSGVQLHLWWRAHGDEKITFCFVYFQYTFRLFIRFILILNFSSIFSHFSQHSAAECNTKYIHGAHTIK